MTDAATDYAVDPLVAKAQAAPYLSFCMVVRNSKLDLFENALRSVRERAPDAEIVVVETMGKNAEALWDVAKKYGVRFSRYAGPRGDWTEADYAVDDMAAARNHAFSLASGVWRSWLDDDDRIVGGEEAERILRQNGRWMPAPVPGQTLRDRDEALAAIEKKQAPTLEDWLRGVERGSPTTTLIHCPYLYKRDKDGNALVWQVRERFARWDDPKRFTWREAAHEVLVPVVADGTPYAELPHLLWVHDKVWDDAAERYSLQRHSAIMVRQWDAGDRTHRRARYLATWAPQLPELAGREEEFLRGALDLSFTDMDRYRARVALGCYYASRGLMWDARDHFAAATAIRPDLPDAHYAAGECAVRAEDWFHAANYLRAGVKCALSPQSEVVPREHVVKYPSLLAVVLQRAARFARESGNAQGAVGLLREASGLALGVQKRPEVGVSDRVEADLLAMRAENALNSELAMECLRGAWEHLRRNDEQEKALKLVGAVPHDCEHHPTAVAMEQWSRKIKKHLNDPKAYAAFYNSVQETGWIPTPADALTREKSHPRVVWILDRVREFARGRERTRVLDLGCCDGTVGVPLLREKVPGLSYTGVDVGQPFLDQFASVLLELANAGEAVADRVTLERGTAPSSTEPFDVVIAGEIIEHVPRPSLWLETLRLRHLAQDGLLLLTTPWGSFDVGHPPATTSDGAPRDERGHVRAYSVHALAADARDSGAHVERLERVGGDATDGMVAALSSKSSRERPVAFAVLSALWDWNGSTIEREGMGASETQIKMLGERLAVDGRAVDVYGPTPQEEVHRGVGYFPKAAVRHRTLAKLVVSRAPSWIRQLDEWTTKKLGAVLWLQDTHYADLTPAVADRYETIVCVSDWHSAITREALARQGATAETLRRITTIYNHVDERLYEPGVESGWAGVKEPLRFVYASSPDRGLVRLLELWPDVRKKFHEATLHVFYGWRGAAKLSAGNDATWNKRYLTSRRRYEELRRQPGVVERGMVSPLQMALEWQKATALLYPGDFHETFGTVASEAAAAGCVPVLSALAGLKESANVPHAWQVPHVDEDGKHLTGYEEHWLDGVRYAVELGTAGRQAMARAALAKFGWCAVEAKWKAILQ